MKKKENEKKKANLKKKTKKKNKAVSAEVRTGGK